MSDSASRYSVKEQYEIMTNITTTRMEANAKIRGLDLPQISYEKQRMSLSYNTSMLLVVVTYLIIMGIMLVVV